MKKICVVTSTRAEYGILTPLIKRISDDDDLSLQLIVTGTHLSEKHGMTVNQIRKDGFEIFAEIPILEDGNTPLDISVTVSNALRGFALQFHKEKPDIVVVLGDRTEILGVAIAAMNENIMIAHINGGELTEGAVDDCVRHSLSKMSYLHFASTDLYKKRIIQMGESPDRVYNVGALSTENILSVPLLSKKELCTEEEISPDSLLAVVTLHPETIGNSSPKNQALLLCECMRNLSNIFFLITAANADTGGDIINDIFRDYANQEKNAKYVISLGMRKYLSAVKAAEFVLGNSSSGIIEAPVLGTPTVNVGNRESGRLLTDSIINVPFEKDQILDAIEKTKTIERRPNYLYGNGDTSKRILDILRKYTRDKVDIKKSFYDINDMTKI